MKSTQNDGRNGKQKSLYTLAQEKLNHGHPFKEGQPFRNNNGEYIVLNLNHEYMYVQYITTGDKRWHDIKTQQRIWERLGYLQPKDDIEARVTAIDQKIIDAFIEALIADGRFRMDTMYHANCLEYWHKEIFQKLSTLTPADILQALDGSHIMVFGPSNKPNLKKSAMRPEIVGLLKLMNAASVTDAASISAVFNPENRRNLKGIGPFFITQTIAAAHPGELTAMGDEKNYIPKTLQYLGVADREIEIIGSSGKYLEANEMCRQIYDMRISHLMPRVCERHSIPLTPYLAAAVMHNFTYHYGRYAYPADNLDPQFWFYDDKKRQRARASRTADPRSS
jgi:hypothetical protein